MLTHFNFGVNSWLHKMELMNIDCSSFRTIGSILGTVTLFCGAGEKTFCQLCNVSIDVADIEVLMTWERNELNVNNWFGVFPPADEIGWSLKYDFIWIIFSLISGMCTWWSTHKSSLSSLLRQPNCSKRINSFAHVFATSLLQSP